jgi:protein phosphatase
VDLLTIGAFSRAARLSPKALRLYDSLGLLTPAHVDEVSGYRFYRPEQLERARLVAWLRRLGMPLARIGAVCDLARDAPDQAAGLIAAYWSETEAELTARRTLAAHLISYLSGEEPTMDRTQPALAIRYAARSDIGRHRERNQDTAYAGRRLLAVADGMGADGEAASAAVIEALKPLEAALPAGNLLNAMEEAVRQVGAALADGDPGTGTTLTAMLWSGSQLALVHVGDTRAYLLRAGAPGDPEQAVGRLIDLANAAGGPDNIACVVADVVGARPGSD